jgi:NADH:ubiquinone oxidoreductase subunit E
MNISCEEKEKRYKRLKQVIKEYRNSPGPLIQILHRAQNIFGYLPKEVQRFIAKEIGTSVSRVYGVVTFYDFFRLDPVGKYTVTICLGTACYVKGGSEILKTLKKELKVEEGRTTKDRLFTLTTARCFGSCGLAPAMMVDKEVYGRMSSKKALQVIEEYKIKKE